MGDKVDPLTIEECQARLEEIEEKLASDSTDPGDKVDLQGEREDFHKYLSGVQGLGGKTRREPDRAEKDRQIVTHGIRTAIKQIAENLPDLARHLFHSITTGNPTYYSPEKNISWNS